MIDSEEALTTFTNSCAQAGAVKCPPAGMIPGNATGSDVHTLITSTVDVSQLLTSAYCVRWLTPDQQLALKLQRVGYTGLPGQVGELKRKSCTFRLRIQLKNCVCFAESLFNGLYFPTNWPTFVNQQVYPALVAILTAGRAYNFTDPYVLPKNPVGILPGTPPDAPTSSSTDAIAGADGVLSNGVSIKKVFQDLVRTTRNRTPTCMSSFLISFADHWIDRQPQLVLCGPPCE